MKLVSVIGARPQFIKAAVVSREIQACPELSETVLHTGQHFDWNMSEIFFREMEIAAPRYNLNVNSAGHGEMTGRMLVGIEGVLLKEKPDGVLVYGDTNSTLAGALAAKKLCLKVVHVEAGLRSYNLRMPEEINRILTDRISDLLCCPTERAVENLRREGFDHFPCRVERTGDVMRDAAEYYRESASRRSVIVEKLGLAGKEYALCTVHRAENTDDPRRLAAIVGAMNEISREMEVVLPMHPRTENAVRESGIRREFRSLPPVGYLDMIRLLTDAKIVLTDSGGLQKEAFFFAKPCVTLREETEWVELVEAGFNKLAGAGKDGILAAFKEMKDVELDFNIDLYGSGNAGRATVEAVRQLLGK